MFWAVVLKTQTHRQTGFLKGECLSELCDSDVLLEPSRAEAAAMGPTLREPQTVCMCVERSDVVPEKMSKLISDR